MSVELDFDTGPALPMRVIALGVIALVVGCAFGFAASQAVFTNQLESTRLDDARAVHDALKPKVDSFEVIKDELLKLDPDKVDFEAAAKFAKADFAVEGTSIGDRTLFDAVAIDNITGYTADSNMLIEALKEHDRLTNKVDKDELVKLMEENEVLQNEYFGVLFDFRHALKNGGEENYLPREGRLVINRGPVEGETGKVNVEVPLSGKEQAVEIQAFIPIAKSQILKSSGGNAMTRYNFRVRKIKFRTIQLSKQSESLLQSLVNIYDEGAVAAPTAAAPAEEPAAEEEPAEAPAAEEEPAEDAKE